MKQKLILFILIFLFSLKIIFSQKQFVKAADRLFEGYAYNEAAAMYLTLLQQQYNYDYNYKLAECYRNMNLNIDAEYWYSELVKQQITNPAILLHYAELLKMNGKYKSAKNWFLQYAKYDANGYYLAGTCDYALNNLNELSEYRIDTLAINSPGSDISPAFFKDGILFASSGDITSEKDKSYLWTGYPFYDLYYTQYIGGNKLTKHVLFNHVNSGMHDASPYFDEVHQQLYFTRNNFYKGRQQTGKHGEIKLDLYTSALKDNSFQPIKKFQFNNNKYSMGQPCISPDGSILLFVSDMEGGIGGTDIYFCQFINNGWTTPQNMGDVINTPGNEMFPFIAEDGKFYFASNWHPGFGGLDVFISNREGDHWSKPENMGFPINSSFDDFSLIIKNGQGFFSSNRIGGKGSDDIYSFVHLKPVQKIQVRNSKREMVQMAKVILNEDGQTIDLGYTNEQGLIDVPLKQNSKYALNIKKDGYLQTNVTSLENYRTGNGILLIDMQELYSTNEHPSDTVNQPSKIIEQTVVPVHERSAIDSSAYTYDVQIGVFKNPDYNKLSFLAQLGELSVKSRDDGSLQFSIINFSSKQLAENAKQQAINKGYKDAFVITYKNGVMVE